MIATMGWSVCMRFFLKIFITTTLAYLLMTAYQYTGGLKGMASLLIKGPGLGIACGFPDMIKAAHPSGLWGKECINGTITLTKSVPESPKLELFKRSYATEPFGHFPYPGDEGSGMLTDELLPVRRRKRETITSSINPQAVVSMMVKPVAHPGDAVYTLVRHPLFTRREQFTQLAGLFKSLDNTVDFEWTPLDTLKVRCNPTWPAPCVVMGVSPQPSKRADGNPAWNPRTGSNSLNGAVFPINSALVLYMEPTRAPSQDEKNAFVKGATLQIGQCFKVTGRGISILECNNGVESGLLDPTTVAPWASYATTSNWRRGMDAASRKDLSAADVFWGKGLNRVIIASAYAGALKDWDSSVALEFSSAEILMLGQMVQNGTRQKRATISCSGPAALFYAWTKCDVPDWGSKISDVENSLKGSITSVFGKVVDIQNAHNQLVQDTATMQEQLKSAMTSGYNTLKQAIEATQNAVKQSAQQSADALKAVVSDLNAARAADYQATVALVNAIDSKTTGVIGKIVDSVSGMQAAVSTLTANQDTLKGSVEDAIGMTYELFALTEFKTQLSQLSGYFNWLSTALSFLQGAGPFQSVQVGPPPGYTSKNTYYLALGDNSPVLLELKITYSSRKAWAYKVETRVPGVFPVGSGESFFLFPSMEFISDGTFVYMSADSKTMMSDSEIVTKGFKSRLWQRFFVPQGIVLPTTTSTFQAGPSFFTEVTTLRYFLGNNDGGCLASCMDKDGCPISAPDGTLVTKLSYKQVSSSCTIGPLSMIPIAQSSSGSLVTLPYIETFMSSLNIVKQALPPVVLNTNLNISVKDLEEIKKQATDMFLAAMKNTTAPTSPEISFKPISNITISGLPNITRSLVTFSTLLNTTPTGVWYSGVADLSFLNFTCVCFWIFLIVFIIKFVWKHRETIANVGKSVKKVAKVIRKLGARSGGLSEKEYTAVDMSDSEDDDTAPLFERTMVSVKVDKAKPVNGVLSDSGDSCTLTFQDSRGIMRTKTLDDEGMKKARAAAQHKTLLILNSSSFM